MIILTPELAECRMEARKIFPNPDFLPGDDCPSGQKVVRLNGEPAIVLRPYKPGPDSAVVNGKYWWHIELPNTIHEGKPMVVLEWPPCLRKV